MWWKGIRRTRQTTKSTVVFAKRFQDHGAESDLDPTIDIDELLPPDGVVVETTFVARFESEAQHGQEALDEDDGFLGSGGSEVWNTR